MNCVICGKKFVPRNSLQKTCLSVECQRKLQLKRIKEKNKRENKSLNYHELFKKTDEKPKSKQQNELMDQCKHPDCKYRGRFDILICCNYLYKTNKFRGCKISECDKYEPKE